ncbi:MAG TPA: hypothetical protein VN193_02665 [Candidatus Angelobacter sp.]|jgi:hypothetical protein|nr:hypothetical protein [Candidatus Angelobacter sp.]
MDTGSGSSRRSKTDTGALPGPTRGSSPDQGPIDLAVTWLGAPARTCSILRDGREITEVSVVDVVDDLRLGSVWRETYSRECGAHPDAALCP